MTRTRGCRNCGFTKTESPHAIRIHAAHPLHRGGTRVRVVLSLIAVFVGCSTNTGRADEPAGKVAEEAISSSVKKFLESADGLQKDQGFREAMLHVVSDFSPELSKLRWEGRHRSDVFVVVVRPVPHGTDVLRTGPATLKMVNVIAFNELLKTEPFREQFEKKGLVDLDALGAATGRAGLTGVLKNVRHEQAISGEYAVAYAIVDEAQVVSAAADSANAAAVTRGYLQCMHERVLGLIEKKRFDDALALLAGLRSKHLGSEHLLLAEAECLRAAGRNEEAVGCLRRDFAMFIARSSPVFLERVGNFALECGARDLAKEAYRTASTKLLESETPQ